MKKFVAALVTMAALSAFGATPVAPAPAADKAPAAAPAAPAKAAPAVKTPFLMPENMESDGPFSPKKCFKRCMKEIDNNKDCNYICGTDKPA